MWERAKGVHVWDTDGKKYLDLTAAFAVAATGHANPRVTRAAQAQLAKLPHAMGDVHPHPLKGQLARELSKLTFERWKLGRGKTIFCNSGFEAVEAALKTALLATGKKDIIAFEGAYHGLGYGALAATHRKHFRKPFTKQLGKFGHFAAVPHERCTRLGRHRKATAQGAPQKTRHRRCARRAHPRPRGHSHSTARVPRRCFARLCDRHGALLIL